MTNNARTVSFETTLSAFGNNTGIIVPTDAISQLDAGARPAVDVEVNGYRYRSTVAVMAGKSLISVSAAIRKTTGLVAGDAIHVTLTVNESPREVEIPGDLAEAFAANPGTEKFFASLSNSLQRYHLDTIGGAKTDETRQKRVTKAINLFLEEKKR